MPQVQAADNDPIRVTSFLSDDYVTDGSVSYQKQIQKAINSAAATGGEVVFSPISYLINDPVGLRIHSNLTLRMEGARFLFSEKCVADGQLFLGQDVTNLRFQGGTIVGRNDVWPVGTNIRGIHLVGECKDIRIRDMHIRDLSSNGIGVFAADLEHPATDVRILDTIIDNCCNVYGDYQASAKRGPEKGSNREDQGLIAMYYVNDFIVRGCRLENSRADGTHFFFCRNGQFNENFVYRSKMGGYFIESCNHVIAANNIIRDNGSRGTTIERGSQNCSLIGNNITGSGREGLWIPDSLRCVITGNTFSLNGRKTNGKKQNQIWNANITINQASNDTLATPTAHYLIANNIIETDQHQIAAIRVDTRSETINIVIQGNLLIGNNTRILIEGPDQQSVKVLQNIGGKINHVTDDE
ncbi:MAG: right-handed parallel beta-helix repeat-containing protein [Gimesia sp.]